MNGSNDDRYWLWPCECSSLFMFSWAGMWSRGVRGACGVSRWDWLSNESVYEACDRRERGSGVECGVVEWVKRSTLRWFGHIERMQNEEFVKKVYLSSVEGTNRRGRPLGRWENRVKEYVSERGVGWHGLEWARKECMDGERWRSVFCDHPLWGFWDGRSIDWLIDCGVEVGVKESESEHFWPESEAVKISPTLTPLLTNQFSCLLFQCTARTAQCWHFMGSSHYFIGQIFLCGSSWRRAFQTRKRGKGRKGGVGLGVRTLKFPGAAVVIFLSDSTPLYLGQRWRDIKFLGALLISVS